MLWFFLIAAVVTAIFLDSARLLFLSLLALAMKAFPRVVLPSVGAVIVWAIKTHWR